MKRISALMRVNLGLLHDESEVSPQEIIELVSIVPLSTQEVEPLAVTYTDIDTGLVIKEHHFDVEG